MMRKICFSLALLMMLSVLAACGSSANEPSSVEAAVALPTAGPMPTALPLAASRGTEIGSHFEAFMSPQQEGAEEQDTPSMTPPQFKSTTPSQLRNERTSRGHGQVRFTRDLTRAFVDVHLEGVKLEEVNMFHIHCGKPGQLGPILIDFANEGNLQEQIADSMLSVEITNEDIEKVLHDQHGLVGSFTSGCPIVPGVPGEVTTIGGMYHIAREGELYFNLHTTGQTYYGDIRGQIYLMEE